MQLDSDLIARSIATIHALDAAALHAVMIGRDPVQLRARRAARQCLRESQKLRSLLLAYYGGTIRPQAIALGLAEALDRLDAIETERAEWPEVAA